LVFSYVHQRTKEGQLVSADFFGGMEFYFGMFGGGMRALCIIIALMAVFHARRYTAGELNRTSAMQQKNFGDIRFPTLGEIHYDVFKKSYTGKAATTYLTDQLIVPTRPKQRKPSKSIAQRKEEEVDAVMMGIGGGY
jgi:hypothetical protein